VTWLRAHVRGVAGCFAVFAVGLVVGLTFGPGRSSGDPKSTTVVVTVGTSGAVRPAGTTSP
jgi:hypothetical protein